MDLGQSLVADAQAAEVCAGERKPRSTTQRWRPRPEPCWLPRRAMRCLIRRADEDLREAQGVGARVPPRRVGGAYVPAPPRRRRPRGVHLHDPDRRARPPQPVLQAGLRSGRARGVRRAASPLPRPPPYVRGVADRGRRPPAPDQAPPRAQGDQDDDAIRTATCSRAPSRSWRTSSTAAIGPSIPQLSSRSSADGRTRRRRTATSRGREPAGQAAPDAYLAWAASRACRASVARSSWDASVRRSRRP